MGTGPHGRKTRGTVGHRRALIIQDKIAQSMGWKDYKDALAHRDKDGKIGRGPNYKPAAKLSR